MGNQNAKTKEQSERTVLVAIIEKGQIYAIDLTFAGNVNAQWY